MAIIKPTSPEEKIQVGDSDFERMRRIAEGVDKAFYNDKLNWKLKFMERANFPTVEQLEEHNYREKLRNDPEKYLPFLVYYYEVFGRNGEKDDMVTYDAKELTRTRDYIRKIFFEDIEFVDDGTYGDE